MTLKVRSWTVLLACASAALAQPYVISTIVRDPPGGPGSPYGVAADSKGNFYFASNQAVFKVDANGTVKRVAGGSTAGYSGDGGPATGAQLNVPRGLAVDASGALYIADTGSSRIRKVSPDGLISTVAGNGTPGYSGDGGPATNAQLLLVFNDPVYGGFLPEGAMAVDTAGNLYLVDAGNNRIRKVSPDGIITTVAGNGKAGYSGDGGPATSAQLLLGENDRVDFSLSAGIAVDSSGKLYIADTGNSRIRRVSPDGIITTVYAAKGYDFPGGIAVDAAGNLYIASAWDGSVIKVSPSGEAVRLLTLDAIQDYDTSIAIDPTGALYVAEVGSDRIRRISPEGIVSTVFFAAPVLRSPEAVALDPSGNLYIADTGNGRVRKVSPGGAITTVAENGLVRPSGVALDSQGTLYIADSYTNRVSKVSADGLITTIADRLNSPRGLTVDTSGNLYIADSGNYVIRKISSSGTMTTFAGNGLPGISGDGGPAIAAQLNFPASLAADSVGNIYIAETGAVRKVSPDGIIKSLPVRASGGLAVDATGNLYFANEHVVSRLSPDLVSTILAGRPGGGYSGDNGLATAGQLSQPSGVAVDAARNIYVADRGNNVIRLLEPIGAAPSVLSVVNAASNQPGPIAPGSIVTLYGAALGPPILATFQTNGTVDVGSQLSGRRVLFNGIPGPVLYTSRTQVAAIVPYTISGPGVQVTVDFQGLSSTAVTLPLAQSAPALFTTDSSGTGPTAALNQDGSLNTTANPARIGGFVSLFATGAGQTSPTGIDGKLADDILPKPILPVTVTIGGKPAEVQYAGAASGLVTGLIQINARIPEGVPNASAVPVVVRVGTASSRDGVTIAVTGN